MTKVICDACAGTGFTDKINRQPFAMEPRDKLCPACGASDWRLEFSGDNLLADLDEIADSNTEYSGHVALAEASRKRIRDLEAKVRKAVVWCEIQINHPGCLPDAKALLKMLRDEGE